jgi:two-component system chemotaxis sensor kinase CheA
MSFAQFIDSYLQDAAEGFQRANRALLVLEASPGQKSELDEVLRVYHTLKSASMMLEFTDVAELAHAGEDLVDHLRRDTAPTSAAAIELLLEVNDLMQAMVQQRSGRLGTPPQNFAPRIAELEARLAAHAGAAAEPHAAPPPPSRAPASPAVGKIGTIRVPADILDTLFNQIGELTLTKNRIGDIIGDTPDKELRSVLAVMRRLVAALQETISLARMVQVGEILGNFPRMAHDLALAQGKEVDVVVEGADTEMDKGMLDAIGEPLLHLVRNAVDHGIEPPEQRRVLGKPQRGRIRISARRTESHVLVEVEDDGSGIRLAEVRQAAVRAGLVAAAAAESVHDNDLLNLLFDHGITTAEQVTGLSGRGMGLRIVKTSARELGGSVEVTSRPGRGSCFTLRLPLTTAVIPMLMVGVGGQVFGIPSDIVAETVRFEPRDVRRVYSETVLLRRNKAIPFAWLADKLGIDGADGGEESQSAVIIRWGEKTMGLGVGAVISQMENIVKPIDPVARHRRGISGGMVLGDGRVALLLDIPTLFNFEALARTAP